MAAAKKTYTQKPDCVDCVYSYDPHSKALDGHFILIRCKFEKWSKFCKHDGCDKFKRKH